MPIWLIPTFLKVIPAWAWKFIAVIVAILSIYLYGYTKGKQVERVRCETAARAAQKAADAQDVKAAVEQRDQATSIAAQLQDQKAKDDLTIEHLKTTLAGKPLNAPCYYPDVAPTGRVRNVPAKSPKGAGN